MTVSNSICNHIPCYALHVGCSWLWVYLPFDVHRIHKRLGDVRWISTNVYAYVMLLLRTFCNLWLISHILCNSFLWKTHAVTSVSDSKKFIQLFSKALFPFRDHPFKTSAFFSEGEGSKICQICRRIVVKNADGER